MTPHFAPLNVLRGSRRERGRGGGGGVWVVGSAKRNLPAVASLPIDNLEDPQLGYVSEPRKYLLVYFTSDFPSEARLASKLRETLNPKPPKMSKGLGLNRSQGVESLQPKWA